MTSVGHYEFESPIYKRFVEKNKCIHTNDRLDTKHFNLN